MTEYYINYLDIAGNKKQKKIWAYSQEEAVKKFHKECGNYKVTSIEEDFI